MTYIAESIDDAFGSRCPEFVEGCGTCEAWKEYDDLLSLVQEARDLIGGDLVGLEWKIACRDFVANAAAVLVEAGR